MDSSTIERPISKILYRQCSSETRLSPVHLSEESDLSTDDEKEMDGTKPVIVEFKPKKLSTEEVCESKTPPPSRKGSGDTKRTGEGRDFLKELKEKLEKTCIDVINAEKIKNEKEFFNNREDQNIKISKKMKAMNDTDEHLIESSASTSGESQNSEKYISGSIDTRNQDPVSKHMKRNTDLKNEVIERHTKKSTPVALLKELKYVRREKDALIPSSISGKERSNACLKTNAEKMAAVRPKSPKPGTLKNDKEESFWDKLGTIGRKKRIKEVQEVEAVEAEGKYAIESPGNPVQPDIPPEDYELGENEERSMVDPKAFDDPKFKELEEVLIEWINDELASQRIIVQDLAEDLYDGQVLQKLLEKLTGDKLDVPEVTQSEEGQKQKLAVVLDHFNKVLGIQRLGHNKWNVEAIHSKNIVPIMHLLVALARHFRPPVRLPEHVSVKVVVVQKSGGQLAHKVVREKITTAYEDVGMRCERDAFDTLFDHAPDKLKVVKKSLVTFVNKHLNKINLEVTELESQFHDGVYLIMLMGLLEGFFVPLYSFFPTAKDFDQKVHNVAFAFELMEEVGLQRPKARPEDVVNMDLKSTLRVLYNLFLKYRNIM